MRASSSDACVSTIRRRASTSAEEGARRAVERVLADHGRKPRLGPRGRHGGIEFGGAGQRDIDGAFHGEQPVGHILGDGLA